VVDDIPLVNRPPVGNADNYKGKPNVPITGDLLANDFDPDGDNLLISTIPVTGPSNGTLTINPDGTFIYTPDPGFTGTDSFVYQVCDDGTPSLCVQVPVTFTVIPQLIGVNTTVGVDDGYGVNKNTSLSGNVLDNDYDPEGDNQGVSLINNTSHGTLTLNPDGSFNYVPDLNYFGPDQFIYVVCDDGTPVACDTATSYITVLPLNDPPIAVNDINNTLSDIPVFGNVLTNDFDPNGDNLTVNTIPVSGPNNGTVILDADGSYTYTPDPGYTGTDSFVYEVCDDGVPQKCSQASVDITVINSERQTNRPPVGNPDNYKGKPNVTITGNLLANDFDPDGDNLLINTTPVSGPSHGILTINADGTFSYTPDPGFIGTDSFIYEVCDDGTPSICVQVPVTFTVIPQYAGVNTTVGVDDGYGVPEDTPLVGNVLDNDYDPEGDNQAVSLLDSTSNGSVNLNPDGSFTYVPDPGYSGPDRFIYVVCDDGIPTACDTATSYITVIPVNSPPVTFNEVVQVCSNETLNGNVLLNGDYDPEGTALTVSTTPVTLPLNGNFSVNANGDYTYIPNTGYVGPDMVVVSVCDNGIPLPSECTYDTIFILVHPFVIVSAGPDATVCEGDCVNITTSFAPSGSTYLWSTGETDASITVCPTSLTTYTVTVTDLNGCTGSDDAVITVNPAPIADAGPDKGVCDGNCTDLTASGAGLGGLYLWSNGSTNTLINVCPTITTNYTVTVTDVNGCSDTDEVTVNVTTYPTANAGSDQTVCYSPGVCASITASGAGVGGTYSWSTGHTDASITVCPTSTTTYTVTVADINGCSDSDEVTLDVYIPPTIVTQVDKIIQCEGTYLELSVNITSYPAPNLQWYHDGVPIPGGTNINVVVDSLRWFDAGLYYCEVDHYCGLSRSDTIEVIVNFTPVFYDEPPQLNEFCEGDMLSFSVDAGGTRPITFQWYKDGVIIPGETDTLFEINTLDPTDAGAYTCVANNVCGTRTTHDALVVITQLPVITNQPLSQTVCEGDSVSFYVGSQVSWPHCFAWYKNGIEIPGAVTETLTFNPVTLSDAGFYTVRVRNLCGSVYSNVLWLAVMPKPQVDLGPDTTIIVGTPFTLDPGPADAYIWSTGSTDQTCPVFASGNYSVTVTDGNGCTGSDDINVFVVNAFNLGGQVVYNSPASPPMANTALNLSNPGNTTNFNTQTSTSGSYLFNDIPGDQYHLMVSTNIPWGGVNTTDALTVMQHFVGMTQLTGLCLEAADVDGSGYTNTIDALHIQQRFTNATNHFISGDWVFDDGDIITLNGSTGSLLSHNIGALCYGDVNGSYVLTNAKINPTISLKKEGVIEVDPFTEVEFPVKTVDPFTVGAVSLIINCPPGIEILEVKMANGNDNLVYSVRDRQLRISWYNLEGLELNVNDELFIIKLNLSNNISNLNFSLDAMSEIADRQAKVLDDIKLIMPSLHIISDEYILCNNYPNPFNHYTNIEYHLPESGKVVLEVFSTVGDKIATLVNEKQEPGDYCIEFDGSGLASGVYYYRISVEGKTRDFKRTRMMVVNR
jgi:hypothetical protein